MNKIISSLASWQPSSHYSQIESIDMHTGGEPLRIYLSGTPESNSMSILEYRDYVKSNFDQIRTQLMFEPRGHADMYGCIIIDAEREDSDFGVIFLHNEGYSSMCGHAIIALTTAMYECGIYDKTKTPMIKIDAPAGQIKAYAHTQNDSVYFHNVPSYVSHPDIVLDIDGLGKINADIAFGGAFYVYVDADKLGIQMDSDHAQELISVGMKIKNHVMQHIDISHPEHAELSFLYGTIFMGNAHGGNHSRNVCIFADGEVDRSPTGTGVSGRLAIHMHRGEISLNQAITIESIIGSTFTCQAIQKTTYNGFDAIIPQVEGSAYITGRHKFLFNPNDSLNTGFFIR